jgi:hypothetical protein
MSHVSDLAQGWRNKSWLQVIVMLSLIHALDFSLQHTILSVLRFPSVATAVYIPHFHAHIITGRWLSTSATVDVLWLVSVSLVIYHQCVSWRDCTSLSLQVTTCHCLTVFVRKTLILSLCGCCVGKARFFLGWYTRLPHLHPLPLQAVLSGLMYQYSTAVNCKIVIPLV